MNDKTYNVLFLCTGNSARSVLAETILNHVGKGRFKAYSAGSHPNGQVNPYAIKYLQQQGLPTEGLRSKSWDEFAGPEFEGKPTPHFDFIITVCDNAAGEVCPLWTNAPGKPTTGHWGIEDPAAVEGTDAEKLAAFSHAFSLMNRRVSLLVNLPDAKLQAQAIKQELNQIGALREQGL
ncbi:MAG TPA: arsenate reductase ArsC [Rhodocyclaceae bacterium]|nr:arsenate reductase ArsC [Rhodocyclaceae bacterium]